MPWRESHTHIGRDTDRVTHPAQRETKKESRKKRWERIRWWEVERGAWTERAGSEQRKRQEGGRDRESHA